MGLLDILRGVADQADFLPGFDPVKDKQGLLSQLLSGREQYGQTPPIVQPGTMQPANAVQKNPPMMAAPGGANPYAEFAKPRGILKRMITPNSLDRQYDAKHMAFLEQRDMAAKAKQAAEAAQKDYERNWERLYNQTAQMGLKPGAETTAYIQAGLTNPEKLGENLAQQFKPRSIGEGVTERIAGQSDFYQPKTATPMDDRAYEIADRNANSATLEALAAMHRAQNPSPGVTVNTGNSVDPRPVTAKPAQDYQRVWDEDAGTYRDEVIPGTATANERDLLNSKDFQALQAANEQFGAIMSNIDAANELIGTFTAGAGSYLEGIRGTPAKNLAARLETVKANIGFDKLNEMRQTSPTGGALGQVTERELNFLQSVRGSLDSGQSPDQLRQTLQEVKTSLERLQEVREIDFKLKRKNATDGQIVSSDPLQASDMPSGFEVVGMRLPDGSQITEDDIQETMRQTGMSREQVQAALRQKVGN